MAAGHFIHPKALLLEQGGVLPQVEIAYHTYGRLNADRSNVVWVCHALTANSDPFDWWPGLFGEGYLFNAEEYFIVCANIIGSCYGSSGPLTMNPDTQLPFFANFPAITIRDMVKAHQLLQEHLGIERIALGIGGSMGGYQLLEWAYQNQGLFDRLCLLATSARESAWGIGIHTVQRMAIETDSTWKNPVPDAGAVGLRTARAMGMLTYRTYDSFVVQQTDSDDRVTDHRASSYLQHQGEKLVKRFNAQSYHLLTRAMDSHNLGRVRGSMEEVLKNIHADTLAIGISSDTLCPVSEQQYLATHLPSAELSIIDSQFGHDGFLVETEQISDRLKAFMR